MDPKKLSVQELVQLCLDSLDEARWTEFVRRFQPLIAGVVTKCVYRRIGSSCSSLIDDLAQDTYLKICANNFKALRTFEFKHENGFYGFLKVIAQHVVEDHFRGEPPPDTPLDEAIERTIPGPPSRHGTPESMEQEIQINEIDNRLREEAAVPNFSRDYTIFWLYYREGLTAKAISELPGIELGVKGVESLLLRLTRILQEKMGGMKRKKTASGA